MPGYESEELDFELAIESEIELQMDLDAKEASGLRTETVTTTEMAPEQEENETNAEILDDAVDENVIEAVTENANETEADVENTAIERELDGGCEDDDAPNEQENADDDCLSLSLDEGDFFIEDDISTRYKSQNI